MTATEQELYDNQQKLNQYKVKTRLCTQNGRERSQEHYTHIEAGLKNLLEKNQRKQNKVAQKSQFPE